MFKEGKSQDEVKCQHCGNYFHIGESTIVTTVTKSETDTLKHTEDKKEHSGFATFLFIIAFLCFISSLLGLITLSLREAAIAFGSGLFLIATGKILNLLTVIARNLTKSQR
jgi:uncharacterized membrane protein YvbJ